MGKQRLYYGDNLDVLRRHIKDETVDLVYVDPPFNSKRNYNQIYNNIGGEDQAQAQAFMDTWVWDTSAREGFQEILANEQGRFQEQTVELIKGLRNVLKEGSLLAYLVGLTLRVTEIHRVLKQTGSFYLHCDPTASHYLKLIIDAIFCSQGGDFRNEIVWCYSIGGKSKNSFGKKHDVIFWYTKSSKWKFNADDPALRIPRKPDSHMKVIEDEDGITWQEKTDAKTGTVYRYPLDKVTPDYWTDIEQLNREDAERLGYPTQKPRRLLERIIKASSEVGDVVLDAYCGCGTSIEVAHRFKRDWIGIDITYQSIALILKRLEEAFGHEVVSRLVLNGIPKDMASAIALANKKDDRVRKEFEKWAVLTYSNNRAIINEKKGGDGGIDGVAFFLVSKTENEKIIFQAKSGNVGPREIRDLRGTMEQEQAKLGIFLTLQEPTQQMEQTAHAAGTFKHPLMDKNYGKIQIVTIQDILEKKLRLEMPLVHRAVKSAAGEGITDQKDLF